MPTSSKSRKKQSRPHTRNNRPQKSNKKVPLNRSYNDEKAIRIFHKLPFWLSFLVAIFLLLVGAYAITANYGFSAA